jgi:hypothetical protein
MHHTEVPTDRGDPQAPRQEGGPPSEAGPFLELNDARARKPVNGIKPTADPFDKSSGDILV